MIRLLEPLRLEQSVGEINHQPYGNEGRERIVEDHGVLLRGGRRRWCSRPKARRSQDQWPTKRDPTSRCSFPDACSRSRAACAGRRIESAHRLSARLSADEVTRLTYVFEMGGKATL